MNFPDALALINHGMRARRASWLLHSSSNPQFVYLVAGSTFTVSRAPLNVIYVEGTVVRYLPHIDAAYPPNSEGETVCGVWTPTQQDLMADDWQTLEACSATTGATE